MKIYAICLVKNEGDVIAECLSFAAGFCERILVFDNGSTDGTWESVHEVAKRHPGVVPFQQSSEPFHNGLRARIYNAFHQTLSSDDWWLILDSDEFLAEDPRPVIESAMRAGDDLINSWQIQFYLTEKDVARWFEGVDTRQQSIRERRRHYLINWQESRLFRNDPSRQWVADNSQAIPQWLGRAARRRILNRHYQYRDPDQISARLQVRRGHYQFPHVGSADWQAVVRDSRTLNYHRDGAPWRFSLSGVLYFHRRQLRSRLVSAVNSTTRRLGLS